MLGSSFSLSHFVFVDNVLLFCDKSKRDVISLKEILKLYCLATYMRVTKHKSFISFHGVNEDNIKYILHSFPYQHIIKYSRFHIKPNYYGTEIWEWLVANIGKSINLWCNRWLFRLGILIQLILSWRLFQYTSFLQLSSQKGF